MACAPGNIACTYICTDDIVKFLLEETKVDPNARNDDGDTPLHLACRNTNSKVVQLLVRNKRCLLDEEDRSENSLLHWACRQPDKQVIQRVFRDLSCDLNKEDGSQYIHPPLLHMAVAFQDKELAQFLVRDRRYNSLEKDSDGDTALHVACMKPWNECILVSNLGKLCEVCTLYYYVSNITVGV